jgi:hypothetical protein
MDLIKNQEYKTLEATLTPIVYIYLAGWFLLFILAMIVQYKTRSEEDKKREIDENAKYFLQRH